MKNGFSSIKKYGRPKDAAPNTEKEDFRNRVRSDNAIFHILHGTRIIGLCEKEKGEGYRVMSEKCLLHPVTLRLHLEEIRPARPKSISPRPAFYREVIPVR